MSLVAYADSSDEGGSDYEDKIESIQVKTLNDSKIKLQPTFSPFNQHGHISDEDDYTPEAALLQTLKTPQAFGLLLPKPKNMKSDVQDLYSFEVSSFAKLPIPRKAGGSVLEFVEEKDDEFLRKKATPSAYEANDKKFTPPPTTKGAVKITIPSLCDFKDVDIDLANVKNKTSSTKCKPKGSNLLSILPKAKSEQNFARAIATKVLKIDREDASRASAHSFLPDTVTKNRPALNTENVDRNLKGTIKNLTSTENLKLKTHVDCSDSEDDEQLVCAIGEDFFSLNASAEQLPEVSTNEINAMVAKRVAEIAAAKTKYYLEDSTDDAESLQQDYAAGTGEELRTPAQTRYNDHQLNPKALQALIGSSLKRRRNGRQQQSEIQVMDISSDEVLPNRDEWMRTALASSTAYQPKGILTDEEPSAGTRRKHQITYLAHKAKSNEAELQAMWATNRQNRRATQSKYGF